MCAEFSVLRIVLLGDGKVQPLQRAGLLLQYGQKTRGVATSLEAKRQVGQTPRFEESNFLFPSSPNAFHLYLNSAERCRIVKHREEKVWKIVFGVSIGGIWTQEVVIQV